MKARYFLAGITITLLTYFGCTTKNDIPESRLINEIIIETIRQDSLDTSIPMSNKLINYYILEIPKNSDLEFLVPPRNERGEPLVIDYFRKRHEHSTGYTISSEDSVYIEQQINNAKKNELDSTKFKDVIQVKDITHWNQRNNNLKRFYSFYMPIFNSDKTFAWVEYGYICKGCGGGKMVVFRKTNNTWLKIDSYITWRN